MKSRSGEVAAFVRIRPTANFSPDLIECLPDGQTVNVHQRKDSRKPQDTKRDPLLYWSFRLEGVLQDVSQEEVYVRVCQRVVLGALDGYNGTLMCFGQTGAGKTFTMTGSTESYKQRGVIPRALQEVFREVEKRTAHFFSVHLSYLEIYNETLVDLLSSLQGSRRPSPRGMVVTEEPGRGVFIRGLSRHPVHSEEEALNLLFEGGLNQMIGSHALNRNSSRSHSIFTLHIESRSRTLCDAKYVTSKLNLVDLAGSERAGKTGSGGQMFKEAMYINKSMSFLEQTILALADRRRDHVPFRQTKLTHVLKDSLGGNCNTVLVANIYGEAAQIEETLSTLRFASRMKRVRTNPAVNECSSPEGQIKKLNKEVKMLKEELSIFNTLAYNPPSSTLSKAQLAEINSQVQRYLDGTLEEISIVSIRQVQAVFAQLKLAVHKPEKGEASICQTDNSVEKDQSAKTAGIKWGSTDDVEDGRFEASSPSQKNLQRLSSAKAKKSKDKHSQSRRREEASPVSKKHLESASKSKLNSVQMPEGEEESPEPDTEGLDTQESQPANEPVHLDSTRPKAEAFEDFKVGPGSKINSILKENKSVLLERRSLLRQISEEVNAVKSEIDGFTVSVQQQPGETREGQVQYLVPEEEPDATSQMQLKGLKGLYRQRYQVLREVKAEVNYCQQLVDQCRVRLLSEFENWWEQAFPVSEELDLTTDKGLEHGKDNQRPSDLDPRSFHSFCNARCRMLKLRNAQAVSSTSVLSRLPPC